MTSSSDKSSLPVILIIGKNGQVGWELQRSMVPLGKVIATGQQQMDLTDTESIRSVIREISPDIIINAAAYTAVDKAEQEHETAYQVNGVAPGVMAEEALTLDALLIHYSTDYVFNGSKGSAYLETDQTNPLNIYGASKLAGEEAIKAIACQYLILRTSWVFASRGQNFLLSMLKLARERSELSIVADQMGAPTSARLIADVTSHIIQHVRNEMDKGQFQSGLYHLVSSGKTSWHGFAEKIIQSAKASMPDSVFKVKDISAIETSQYPTPAKRPLNSLLTTDKLTERFGVNLSDWRNQVDLCIKEL